MKYVKGGVVAAAVLLLWLGVAGYPASKGKRQSQRGDYGKA